LEKELDEYVYNPAEAKERLPQSPYRRLELIPEAARDIIKVKKIILSKINEFIFISSRKNFYLNFVKKIKLFH